MFQDPPESPTISKLLPHINGSALSGTLLMDIASHFVRVYAAIWAAPLPIIRQSAEAVIAENLGRSLNYSSVHKRVFEGGCSKLMTDCTSLADYSADEIPMYHEEWKGNLRYAHDIYSVVHSISF